MRESGLTPDSRLPTERALAETLGVARTTIRQAMLYLEGEGRILRTRRGKRGWFVAPPPLRYDPTRHRNTYRNVLEQGRRPSVETLDLAMIAADAVLARLFAVPVGIDLLRKRSIVLIDDRRVCAEQNYLLAEAFPGFLERPFRSPLTTFLEKEYGTVVRQVGFRARAARLSGAEAEALDVVPDTPGLRITRVKTDAAGRIVHVDEEAWIASAIELSVGIPID
ncbi:UTRA domain-containing protein [Reyranella sp. CPCC 100927]|nr:UTRA domain-containing protein [Reyranella sp. CPCC 100927]